MKKCIKCGKINNDENNFCGGCGSGEFTAVQAPPPPPPVLRSAPPMKDLYQLDVFDFLIILGFASAIAGLAAAWVVLEPLGLIASAIGFFKGRRYKAVAVTGMVVSVISFVIILFMALHESGVISKFISGGII